MKAWAGTIFSCETVSAIGKEIQIATALVNIGKLYTDPKKVMVVDLEEWDKLTAENERLTRVVEQTLDCGGFGICTITEDNKGNFYDGWRRVGMEVIIGVGSTETFIAGDEQGSPDLFAQLKGADRG
jgi:hypothetical protein